MCPEGKKHSAISGWGMSVLFAIPQNPTIHLKILVDIKMVKQNCPADMPSKLQPGETLDTFSVLLWYKFFTPSSLGPKSYSLKYKCLSQEGRKKEILRSWTNEKS